LFKLALLSDQKMDTASFTEFSYGYAMTDNILHSGFPSTPHAPVFPSLLAEGATGGGYDVQIPLCPVAVFLQFKIPQVVRRRSRLMPTGFATPYLRMHLRTKRPNQHQLLLDLEATGKLVYYSTPDFWTVRTLDEHFTNQRVHSRSWYIPPSRIGPQDDAPHHVAYRRGNPTGWSRSELKKLEGRFGPEEFGETISKAVESAQRQDAVTFLDRLCADIATVAETEITTAPEPDEFQDRPPQITPRSGKKSLPEGTQERDGGPSRRRLIYAARVASYLSQVHLGCTLVLTGKDT
jgi:hypothetical protein